MNTAYLVSLTRCAWSMPINCKWVMRSNFYVTWHFYFIAHTHIASAGPLHSVGFFFPPDKSIFFFLSHFQLALCPFCVSTLTLGCCEQVWIAWIQYKIYTMFYNNYPFKLNFSKWNRISLTSSSGLRFSIFFICIPNKTTHKHTKTLVHDSELAGHFFILMNFSMNYSELHIHHYGWCTFFVCSKKNVHFHI